MDVGKVRGWPMRGSFLVKVIMGCVIRDLFGPRRGMGEGRCSFFRDCLQLSGSRKEGGFKTCRLRVVNGARRWACDHRAKVDFEIC